jgi:hypothetical protein
MKQDATCGSAVGIAFIALALSVLAMLGAVHGETLQDLGLPSTVSFEAVFPQIPFGRYGALQVESELLFINPTDEKAFINVEFLAPDGSPPPELEDYWSNRRVDPHDVDSFCLPPFHSDPVLVEEPQLWWAIMRSNEPVMVVQTLKITDTESGEVSSLTVTGSYEGTESAQVRIVSTKSAYTVGGFHRGWHLGNSGLALANPTSEENRLELILEDEGDVETNQLILAPGTQRSLLIWELFPSFRGEVGNAKRALLTIRSVQNVPFAVSTLEQESRVDLSGGLLFKGDRSPLSFRYLYFKTPDHCPFDFPVEVTDQLTIQDLWFVLSQFGFNLATVDGEPLAVYKQERPKGVTGDTQAGIVVVYGSGSAIIFIQSRKVIKLDSTGGEPEIEDLPKKSQVRIRMGSPCYREILLLDKSKEEIISIEHTRDPGSWCF